MTDSENIVVPPYFLATSLRLAVPAGSDCFKLKTI
jgi:hypothetical protein